MSTKYFRVKKDTFMWKEGAIISNNSNSEEYRAVEDLWDKVYLKGEYISSHIIENKDNSDFFERVYKNGTEKFLYVTADIARNAYNSLIS